MVDWKETKGVTGSDCIDPQFPDYEVIEHRIGNQTNAEENANKFFSAELHKSSNGKWRVYTNYGRVDGNEYTGAVGLYGPGDESDARDFFNKKFKSKCTASKGYKEIEFIRAKVGSPKARTVVKKLSEDEIPEEKKKKIVESVNVSTKKFDIDPTIAKLVDQWYRESSTAIKNNAAVTITKDGMETPLGVLSFKQIEVGKKILGELGEAVKAKNNKEIKLLTGNFYSHIPSALGRKISDSDLINSDAIIQQKVDLLQMMHDSLEIGGEALVGDIELKYKSLSADMEYIKPSDSEWQRIQKKINDTKGASHYSTKTKVRSILKVNLNADRKPFSDCSVDNMQELFHGSRNMNILGILRSGMRIAPPEAPASGLMFDKGAYFADASTKSINYSLYPFPGSERANNCFLFLFNVKLGKIKELQDSDYNASKYVKKDKYNSVKGCAGRSLIYNEYIIYDTIQCSAQYLVELER